MPDELLDVVTDDDIVTRQQLRSIVHQQGLQHRGVHVFLVTPDSQLLVQHRAKLKDAYPLALDCSVSEHLKAGEDYYQAAARGLHEELSVHAVDVQPLVKFRMIYGPNDYEVSLLYEGSIDLTLVRFDPIEVEGIDYYTLDELTEIIQKEEEAICPWFVEIINWYLDMPSKLNIMETYTQQRFLLNIMSR